MWQLGIRGEIDPCRQVSPTMFYFHFIKILGIQSLSMKNSYEALQIPQKIMDVDYRIWNNFFYWNMVQFSTDFELKIQTPLRFEFPVAYHLG
jgi:hypothetical protein